MPGENDLAGVHLPRASFKLTGDGIGAQFAQVRDGARVLEARSSERPCPAGSARTGARRPSRSRMLRRETSSCHVPRLPFRRPW